MPIRSGHRLLTLTCNHDFQSQTSYGHYPHTKVSQFKDRVKTNGWTDGRTTDCFAFPANAVGNNAVDSFHVALRRRFKIAHSNLYTFLGHLYNA